MEYMLTWDEVELNTQTSINGQNSRAYPSYKQGLTLTMHTKIRSPSLALSLSRINICGEDGVAESSHSVFFFFFWIEPLYLGGPDSRGTC
jgi:hypothetical protein